MRVERFEFKRCCCCIPLLWGLLVWGYIKLAVSVLIILPVLIQSISANIARFGYQHGVDLGILGSFFLVVLADIALTIVFIFGAHKKCPKLLNVYNYYSIGLLVLFILAYFTFFGVMFYQFISYHGLFNTILVIKGPFSIGFISVVIQVYLIFLNKAEIAKLKSQRGFRFTNNANEAECKIVEEEGIVANDINDDLENGAYDENITEPYRKSSEQEYEVFSENVKDDSTKLDGNYVKLV